ncbi:MAG: hypothetical protein KGJ23_12750 [Euryarchaeota archaeon]|nr:hypothetical protein [Euryarchaeota archaeon]MDE1837468.1 hypothetical protein [Euryarchaeota archaeon]MDE1881788.1 hypothetical protein [Euryarchaeota archaeon]MDE2045566.1 hypothetical protein [Thermoplasmata archaeon]
MEVIRIQDLSRHERALLLKELGYGADPDGKVTKDGAPWMDPFLGEQPTLDNMCVVPGSALVLVDNPVSLDGYFEKYGDWD